MARIIERNVDLDGDTGSAAVDTVFGFTGKLFDDTTGLQNNLHRWYDSGTGRWFSEDPIGFAGGDANLYRYVRNEPTGWIDSNGLLPCNPFVNDFCPGIWVLAQAVPHRDPTGQIHGDIPKEVPQNWGLETIDEALGEVEESISARVQKGLDKGGLDARHENRLAREKRWQKQLISRREHVLKKLAIKALKKVVGPVFIGVDVISGGPGYAFDEATWPVSEAWRDDGIFSGFQEEADGEENSSPNKPAELDEVPIWPPIHG